MQRPKFQIQQKLMDFSSKIEVVMADSTCPKHSATEGEPCFVAQSDLGQALLGVCGPRSRKIYIGAISEKPKRPFQKENR